MEHTFMLQFLCFLLPPTLTLLMMWIIEKKKQSLPFALLRWCLFAFILYTFTSIALLPFNRITASIAWVGLDIEILYTHFGASAMAFSLLLSICMGITAPFISRHLCLSETVSTLPTRNQSHIAIFVLHSCVLVLLFLTFSYIWALSNYGNISMNEILFHLSISLKGASKELIESFLIKALLRTFIAFLFFELLVHLPFRKSYQLTSRNPQGFFIQAFPLKASAPVAYAGLACWFIFLFACANQSFQFAEYMLGQFKTSELIEQEYVDPMSVQVSFPEKKRNLITIFVESSETSSQDVSNGGFFHTNYIPEMTQLAKENISFSHSDLLEGATIAPNCGWTIAGLVAQSAGLPLKMAYQESWNYADSDLQGISWFMPGATSLGDLLAQNGYRNVFMAGSDFAYGGRKQFYTQHGQYQILDYYSALERNIIPEGYYENWGFEDQILYKWAKEELTMLAESDQPFHFAMLTVDTHMPNGYYCSACPSIHENTFENILACSSIQLHDFISWCKTQPFYEDTSIVITGDHASMVANFYSDSVMDSVHGTTDRKIYNAFINSSILPVQEKNRLFTTLDFFPTTLASIGVTIEGDRLGLGTNLFSTVPTLAEKYGYETLFHELNLKSTFFNEHILQL